MKTGITSISIENFKGFGEKVTIPLKPITLMFGANSAGKSTVLQALLLMNDWLQRLGPDLDTLTLGGDMIHLGGFKQFVHQHDESKMVRIRVECSMEGQELSCFPKIFGYPEPEDVADIDVNRLVDIQSSFVEICFGRTNEKYKPDIMKYTVGVNGCPVVSHCSNHVCFNAHSTVVKAIVGADDDMRKAVLCSNVAGTSFLYLDRPSQEVGTSCIPLEWKIPFDLYFEDDSYYYDYYDEDPEEFQKVGLDRSGIPHVSSCLLAHLASQMLLGVGKIVSDKLAEHVHIGPLRIAPETGRMEDWKQTCWFDGSQAWVEILAPKWTKEGFLRRHPEERLQNEITEVADRLSWKDRESESNEYGEIESVVNELFGIVGLEYQIQCKSSRLLDEKGKCLQLLNGLPVAQNAEVAVSQIANILSELKNAPVQREVLFLDANNTELRPIDLGSGVSQMMPILIGAVVSHSTMSIEEPELHLHPAMQCDLADIFVYRSNWGRMSILETHSEHIILRLLRRMRETAAGTVPEGKELTPDDVAVLYLEPASDGTRVSELRVGKDGQFIDEWPEGFFEEGLKEVIGGL